MASPPPNERFAGRPAQGDGSAAASTERLAEKAKQQAKGAWNDTKQAARETIDERRRDAAAQIGDVAGALRNSAHGLDEEHKETVAHLVGHAAESLERMSESLRTRDLDTLLRDAQSFARNQPVVFFGAALAAGFLATRFLTSSQRSPAEDEATRRRDETGAAEYGALH